MDAPILIAGAALLLGCYFAACVAALKTFSRSRLTDVLEAAGRESRLEPFLIRLPGLALMCGLLRACCNLAVILCVHAEVTQRLTELPLAWEYGITASASLLLLSVFSVAIPTSWARYRTEKLLAWSMPILTALYAIFRPIAGLLHLFDPVIRRISGVDLQQVEDDISDEVLSMVEDHQSGDEVDDTQKSMLEAVFELPTTDAGDVMTPRTEIRGIEVGTPLDEVKSQLLEFGHSRIPVYEENLDHIIGVLYAKDLIRFIGNGQTFDLRQVLREAYMVPESKRVHDLLSEFKARKVHLAIVLDEYGGTAGLVTIEDILEEIVGEIQDEYELADEPDEMREIDATTSEVEARMHVEDLADHFGFSLPESADYDTVGGFVFAQLGHIPEEGEVFEFEGYRFTVTDAERTKVKRVKVEQIDEDDTATPSDAA